MMSSNRGFSLIELMVSVSIIGILASVGAVNYEKFAGRAKYARAKGEMAQISSIIQGLRVSEDKFLIQITGTHCTECTGQALTTWPILGFDAPPMDPWGSVYTLDENEGEFADCRHDWIHSHGADRRFAGLVVPPQGDDAQISVPYHTSHACTPDPYYSIGPDFAY